MLNGWVSLDRAILKHWVSQEPELLAFWVHLLLEANFEDRKRMFNGSLVEIKRGQCVFGLNAFSAKTGISQKKLRRYIDMLESEGMVGRQKNNKFSLISITNYDYYQTEGSQRASRGQARKGELQEVDSESLETRAGKRQAEPPANTGLELFGGDDRAAKGQAEGSQRASEGQHLNKGNNANKGNNKDLSPVARDDAQAVFDYWCYRMGKNSQTKFSPKRRKAVQARFKDGRTVDDLMKAIDGCASSPFNMGLGERSDGTVYNDLELICRNNENLERFMQIYERPPARQIANAGNDILGGTTW